MDIQLPGIDGYEVARRIRADPANAAIPIIAVTSYALMGDEDKARLAGCNDYVSKPYRPRELLVKISRSTRPVDDLEEFGIAKASRMPAAEERGHALGRQASEKLQGMKPRAGMARRRRWPPHAAGSGAKPRRSCTRARRSSAQLRHAAPAVGE